MTTNNNIPVAAPATLSEKELFADVFGTEFFQHSVTGKPINHSLTIRDLLHYYSVHGDLENISPILAKQICDSDQPEREIDALLDALEGMIADMRVARLAYRDFKADRLVVQTDEELEAEAEERFTTKAAHDIEVAEHNKRQVTAIIEACEAQDDKEAA